MQRWAAALMLTALWAADEYSAAERRHWAFQPRRQVAVPALKSPWIRTPVDAFVLARLRQEGLTPAPQAAPRTLVRRLYFDVTGLPPAPEVVARFAAAPTEQAWARLVDDLLASQAHAERLAQHWLDVVRFSETDGFEYDTHRPDAWRYRDYVISAFAADKPYNQFLREQLAGDEMDAGNQEYRIAAGFQRLGPLRKNAGNQEVASSRNEVLVEMTNAVGSVVLGMTLGCARCHDHKFDPIRQRDYYRMQAYFAATHESDVPLTSEAERAAWKAQVEALNKEIEALKKAKQPVAEAEAKMPAPLPTLFSVESQTDKATPIHLLARGEWNRKGDAVGMRPPGILLPAGAPGDQPLDTPRPRTRLAEWLTQPEHPLTARVWVNRLWGFHFGRALAATPNDFGRMGTRPSHPELLDWLAGQLVENGWRSRPIERMLLLSATYRQSAVAASANDPENRLLARMDRRRLDAEEIRDAMLSAAGVLNPKAGGPSVTTDLPPELYPLLYKPSQWKPSPDAAEHNRRSIYLLAKRNMRLPFMEVFDRPDNTVSCPRRDTSTHAPQALEMLNGAFANRMAEAFAARLDREAKTPAEMVQRAFLLTAGRAPTAREAARAVQFLKENPLREFALAMFNLNAFLYVN